MIICDLDGVYANFADAAATLHDRRNAKITKWNFFLDWGLTGTEFWKPIKAQKDNFYREMVLPYPWAIELLNMVSETDDFVIMSSPACGTPGGYAAKKLWVDKYLQPHLVDPIKLIVGSEKYLLAGRDRLLIDDYDQNIEDFREAKPIGGHAVTFPQLWNKQHRAVRGSMSYMRRTLNWWKDTLTHEREKQS